MVNWRKRCEEFKKVRELIEEGNAKEVINMLYEVSLILASDADFGDDFEELADDMNAEMDDCNEATVDYYLSEFYDLCDNARIWLPV